MPNALVVTVDTGPADSGYNVNRLYTNVTICSPGSVTLCQTIDHVLVDTGSTGLRLLASKVVPALQLRNVSSLATSPLLNCVQFVDNTFAWGPVVAADIVLAGETAGGVPIQLIADQAFGSPAAVCSGGGRAMTDPTALGANGILGIGLFKEDCGADCVNNTRNGSYFTCADASCSATNGVTATIAKQVKNPVPLFATDKNGALIDLPPASAAASTLTGALIFGIGTQSNNQLVNNQLASVTILSTDSLGYITTSLTLPGRLPMSNSFIDSGSNGLYFDSNTTAIPNCPNPSGSFYCPTTLTNLSATLLGANGKSSTFQFSIGKASEMFGDSTRAVLPNLAGSLADPNSFDWGLPFFYGRRVFFGIEGMNPSLASGPFYAF
jgi:hypothetical protein